MSIEIKDYHFHLYYEKETMPVAREIAAQMLDLFGVTSLTFHERLVGPHPMWSVELTATKDNFNESFNWLILNHQGLTVFCHPNTGHDLLDHTDHVFWIGESKKLNLNVFKG